MKRVAVLGAGISGLACAVRLQELKKKHGADLEILLLEETQRAGGNIETEHRDGFLLEKGPDSFISENGVAVDFCRRLGIDSKLIPTEEQSRKISVVHRGRLVGLPEGFYLIAPGNLRAFMRTPLFSLAGKLRMISEVLIPRTRSLEDESVGDFIRRRFGKEALERVGQPMIGGIYSGDPEKLSALETMPLFKAFENQYGSVIRGLLEKRKRREGAFKEASGPRLSLFVSFEEGMDTLVRAAVSGLEPGTLKLGQRVTELSRDQEGLGWRILTEKGDTWTVDAVCSSIPADKLSGLLRKVPDGIAGKLSEVDYHSAATINFAYTEEGFPSSFTGSGFVVPASEGRSLTACTFSSRKFKRRSPKGHALLRAFVGGAFGKKYFDMEDKDLVEKVQGDLAALMGIRKKPIFWSLARYPRRMAQYHVGHQSIISGIEHELGRHRGLFLTGCAYRGSGIPNAIKDGQAQAERLYQEIVQNH